MSGAADDPDSEHVRKSRTTRIKAEHATWRTGLSDASRQNPMLRFYEIVGCPPPLHPLFIETYYAQGMEAATEALIEKFRLDAEEVAALRDLVEMRIGPA